MASGSGVNPKSLTTGSCMRIPAEAEPVDMKRDANRTLAYQSALTIESNYSGVPSHWHSTTHCMLPPASYQT